MLAWGLRLGFYLGVVGAALMVRRASIFTAMVQPPLVLVVGIVVGGMLFTESGGLYGTALKIIGTFPTMAIGTAAAVLIGLIRILAQPLKSAARSVNRTPRRTPERRERPRQPVQPSVRGPQVLAQFLGQRERQRLGGGGELLGRRVAPLGEIVQHARSPGRRAPRRHW